MDRIPSFLPATNLVSDVSKKRCRELSSPTGKTPLQECKRQPACVYDRLAVVGVTTCFQGAGRLVDEIGKHNYDAVIQSLKNENPFRLIGDNINISVGVKHERSNAKGTMYSWFASAIVTQKKAFAELSDVPQCLSKDLPLEVLPGPCVEDMRRRNLVVALPVLPFNEQKYADVVQILDHYEHYIEEIYQSAEVPLAKVHIGGDQLTRERFSGAKRLRAILSRNACLTEKQRLQHMQPITFELWHAGMNLLSLIFNVLFNEHSYEKGTMNSARIKLGRRTVKKDVQHNYDHNKDFFLTFTSSYIIEALCDYFGLEDLKSLPTRNLIGEKSAQEVMEHFVRTYVFAENTDATQIVDRSESSVQVIPVTVNLPDGSSAQLHIHQICQQKTTHHEYDKVKHYGHCVLQLGLLLMDFLDICKIPDRDRMISLMKYLMPVYKTSSNNSKYALECLRFLCHQQSSYSLQEAHRSFYGLFVYNRGKIDSSIPADLQMEHIVKKLKILFQTSGPSNKSESMVKKSKAISGISAICDAYDSASNVIVRAKHHKAKTSQDEEEKVIRELRTVHPFQTVIGREYTKFTDILAPYHAKLDQAKYQAWLIYHKDTLMFEYGK